MTWNTEALGFASEGLPSSLPFLSCPSTGTSEQKPTPVPSAAPKTAASSQRNLKRNRLHELYTSPRHSYVSQPQTGEKGGSYDVGSQPDYPSSVEILEAACNESIPGLTGVSNFTVFLYCKLFEGDNESVDPAVFQMGVDLHSTCSDAAWYLSAAEEDLFWIHVCSEFFAHEFNNTVCANSSFWLRRAHQVIGLNPIAPFPIATYSPQLMTAFELRRRHWQRTIASSTGQAWKNCVCRCQVKQQGAQRPAATASRGSPMGHSAPGLSGTASSPTTLPSSQLCVERNPLIRTDPRHRKAGLGHTAPKYRTPPMLMPQKKTVSTESGMCTTLPTPASWRSVGEHMD